MMKKLLLILSVAALASCGGDDDAAEPSQQQPQAPRSLTVVVGENPLQEDGVPAHPMTISRTAAATTTASLSNFILNYTADYHVQFTKSNGSWSTSTWPTQDYVNKHDFYANDGGAFQWNNGDPYVSFTMEESAFNQKDLLVAKTSVAYNDNSGHVSLTFDHACAAVQFYVYKEESASYYVKSIKLQNVKNTGNCRFSDYTWSGVSGTAEYTLTNGDIEVTTTLQKLPCDWLFIIPQDKSGLNLEIKYTKAISGTEYTKSMKVSKESSFWQAGKQYTVNIRIGKSA